MLEAQSQINTWASISGPSVLRSDFDHVQHAHVNLDVSATNTLAEEEISGARIFPKEKNASLCDYDEFMEEMSRLYSELSLFFKHIITQATRLVSKLNKIVQNFLIVSEKEATQALTPAIGAIRAIQIQTRIIRRVPVEKISSCQTIAIRFHKKNVEREELPVIELTHATTSQQHKSERVSIFRLVISMVYRELVYGGKGVRIDNR